MADSGPTTPSPSPAQKITIETRDPGKWLFVDLDGAVWRWNGKQFKTASDEDLERIRSLMVRLLSRRLRQEVRSSTTL
jgi:hypothetical protein